MRDILFRGKRIDAGEWVEGFYFCMVHDDGSHVHHFIMPLGVDLSLGTPIEKIQVEVDLETVCQYTGKSDDNVNKIWEEDFVKINDEWIGRVIWRDDVTAFCVFPNDDNEHETYCLGYYIEEGYKVQVIGNIYDNPDLIGDQP